MTAHNGKALPGGVREGVEDENHDDLEAFDALPDRVKTALRRAEQNYHAPPLLEALHEGVPVAEVVAQIERASRKDHEAAMADAKLEGAA